MRLAALAQAVTFAVHGASSMCNTKFHLQEIHRCNRD